MESEAAVHGVEPRRPACRQRGLVRRPIRFKRHPAGRAPRFGFAPRFFVLVAGRGPRGGLDRTASTDSSQYPDLGQRPEHSPLGERGRGAIRPSRVRVLVHQSNNTPERPSGRLPDHCDIRPGIRPGPGKLEPPVRPLPTSLIGGEGRITAVGLDSVDGPDIGFRNRIGRCEHVAPALAE